MSPQSENTLAAKNGFAPGEAESTLRLIAGLPAPEGLETRVKTALHRGPARTQTAGVLDWPAGRRSWLHPTLHSTFHATFHSNWVRNAAAAAIVCVVAGGSWGVYQRVRPRATPFALPHVGTGGFSSANAMRTPRTLDGPALTHPVLRPTVKAEGIQAAGAAKKRPGTKKKAAGKAVAAKPAAQ